MKKIGFLVIFLFLLTGLNAGIYCPDDVFIDCNHDYHNLDFVGEATTFGNHINVSARYADINSLSACNVGSVQRLWYADINNNGSFESTEPNCTQLITIDYIDHPFSVSFPQDVYLSCEDDIPTGTPSWTSGPCDQVAFSVKDENFVGFSNACMVLQRRYTVINWCKYQPNDPNWNGEGIFEAIQLIHLDDNTKPKIDHCQSLTIPLEEDCMATLSLSKSANDLNTCGTGLLAWYVSVDLWGDGSIDYQYSPEETGDFMLPLLSPDQDVTIDIPERVMAGRNKITWKVVDFCGNVDNCTQEVITADQKAPSPYCLLSTQAVVTGTSKPVVLRASSFDFGAFDNCSSSLGVSFGPSPSDSIRLLDCDDLGFQFTQIYFTDEFGNTDFCSVAYFVMDNGKCGANLSLAGRVEDINGTPQKGRIEAILHDDVYASSDLNQNGIYSFNDLTAHEDLYFSYEDHTTESKISVEDLVLLRDHILGRLNEPFSETIKWLADVNLDGRINPQDMIETKKMILAPKSFTGLTHKIIKKDKITDSNFYYQQYAAPNLLDFDGDLELVAFDNGYISQLYADFYFDNEELQSISSLDENEHKRSFTISQNMLIDGLFIEFEIEAKNMDIQDLLSSEIIDIKNDVTTTNTENGTLFTIVKAFNEAEQLLNDQVIFSINDSYNINDWNNKSRLIYASGSQMTKTYLDIEVPKASVQNIDVSIYPNPSVNGSVNIVLPDNTYAATIVDSQGKHLKTIPVIDQLDPSLTMSFDPGVYFLQVILGEELRVEKFVILE